MDWIPSIINIEFHNSNRPILLYISFIFFVQHYIISRKTRLNIIEPFSRSCRFEKVQKQKKSEKDLIHTPSHTPTESKYGKETNYNNRKLNLEIMTDKETKHFPYLKGPDKCNEQCD